MSRITVGEFDRIIKSLYTNDITMAKTIYGEAGQAGLQDKIIKEVTATAGQGAIVNTYTLVREMVRRLKPVLLTPTPLLQ